MKNFSEKILVKMYVKDKLSIAQIARELNANKITIKKYMKKYNIIFRSQSEANERKCNEKKILSLYQKGLSINLISKKMKIDRRRITNRLKKYNIKIRTNSFYKKGIELPKRNLEWRRNISNSKKKEKNPNWKGGKTEEYRIERRSIEFRIWREKVFLRDNWTCKKCKNRGKSLHPHHIENFSSCFEKRFDIKNGITLCKKCHEKFHSLFGRKNNNFSQIDNFIGVKNGTKRSWTK